MARRPPAVELERQPEHAIRTREQQMRMFLRRIRGLLGLGIFSAAAWAAVGFAIITFIRVVDPPSIGPGEGPLWGAFVFGRAGFVAGVMGGAVLAIAERHRRLADLSLPRVALWGAIGGLLLPWLGAAPRPMMLILGVLGSLSAVAAVALARRSERIGRQALEPRHNLTSG